MLGFPILYCKGMRPMMFQLSGFCYIVVWGLRVYRVQGSPKGPSINMVGSWQQSWAPKVLYIYIYYTVTWIPRGKRPAELT